MVQSLPWKFGDTGSFFCASHVILVIGNLFMKYVSTYKSVVLSSGSHVSDPVLVEFVAKS